MMYKAIQNFGIGGAPVAPGDLVELSGHDARTLLKARVVEPVAPGEEPPCDPDPEPPAPAAPKTASKGTRRA